MSILKSIYRARDEFYQQRGAKPRCLQVCPDTANKIKNELYPHAKMDLSDIPLRILDGMKVTLSSGPSFCGWEIIAEGEEATGNTSRSGN